MSARKQGSDIDLNGNALLNAILQVLASAPGNATTAGRIWYSSADGKLHYGDGTNDNAVGAGGTYTDEQAQDAIAALFAAGTDTGIGFTYNDAGNAISAAVSGITDSMVASGAAISADKTADGTTNKVYTATEKTKLAGIAAGATVYTDEQAQDAVAAALTNGTNITITYNDAANTITIALSGTVTASFISNFDTQVRTSRLDQMAVPTAAVALNNQKLTGIADATANTDVPSYGQILGLLQGRNDKAAVRAAATGNGTLASAYANGSVIDGVTLATNDRILLPLQTTASENGIYTVNATGAPTRATDMDTGAEASNAFVWVSEGATNADTAWKVMNDGTITLGTTALVISKIIQATLITNGTGLTKTGTTLAVDHTVVPFLYTTTVGDGTSTSITVTHNLGTRAVVPRVFLTGSTYDEIDVAIQHTTTNTITLLFNTAPTSGQYTVVVLG